MKRQRGVTLVELVIAIVIIAIAAAALYSAMASITGRSADPMLRQQSLAIAEAYLEEIGLHSFPLDNACSAAGAGNGAARASFDDLCDYDGLSYAGSLPLAPRSVLSATPTAGLVNYRVQVAIRPQALGDIAAANAVRIEITVTDPAGQTLALAGYRTRY
ncbi:hypothetical protein D3C78_708380 [compost metagenome]